MTILRVVDETGSASLGDITEALGDHPDPTSAVLVMVDLAILVIEYADVIDQHSVVRRAPKTPGQAGEEAESCWPLGNGCGPTAPSPAASEMPLPPGIERLTISSFAPAVIVASVAARRSLGKLDNLNRPGIYALVGERQVYVGSSSSVGSRVAAGQQPISDIKQIVVITDATDALSENDARAEALDGPFIVVEQLEHAGTSLLGQGHFPLAAAYAALRLWTVKVLEPNVFTIEP
ncbi:hypothetical protein [Devosia sp. 919]|uniref:hypothetical protein n=1 Tax=Devosia sp. 919 TaxID=2726065 RepID=UPI00155831E7|nr:hypothetical protein [Devosia sp. 919]